MLGTKASRIIVIILSIKKGCLLLFYEISEHVMLVQLIGNSVNDNHSEGITGYWIYDSNCKRALILIK